VALADLVAGLFIIPAMPAVAELATAMPQAGGAYYFLDRALGPLVGTVGGSGWVRGGEVGSPIWARICAMDSGSVRKALNVRNVWQAGQISGKA
jgi:amino acid transporter